MSQKLSKKQQMILDFLKKEVSDKGYPPSVREICMAVDLKSTSTVHTHLTKLEEKGFIRRDPTKPRAIEILDGERDEKVIPFPVDHKGIRSIPIVGEITAGAPILAVESYEESFPLPQDYVEDGDYFMLKIKGESMIEAGIFDKDLVLVRKQNYAQSGEIVVALLDDSATVKTFYKEANMIRLQPENASMTPIYASDVAILGIVKGVFRKF
ncbi:transcriptional repressor LexA [Fusibacter sp. JL298sf-3]